MADRESVKLPPKVRLPNEPDAHGQAAMMLVESLIHTLVEDSTLSNSRAIETVEAAAEVKVEKAALAGESDARRNESLELLRVVSVSLKSDC